MIKLTIDEDLLASFDAMATRLGTSRSALIRESLRETLRRHRIRVMEAQQIGGYESHPIQPGEFDELGDATSFASDWGPNLIAADETHVHESGAEAVPSLFQQPQGRVTPERVELPPEKLAFKLMDLLGVRFAAARLYAKATGGAESGLIFDSDHPIFSRWQVQCKKVETLTVDDVAREVGLTYLLKSNVIVMINTGNIESEARLYADAVMRKTNQCIVMLDGSDLHAINADPTHIRQVFSRESQRIKGLRPLDI